METINQDAVQYERGSFPFGDWARILDIRYDTVFKTVFASDTAQSRGALSDLISSLIGRLVAVETVNANEPPIDDIRQRWLRFDIACKTKKGELVNVEMSFYPKASELVRLEYHAAKLFVGQDIHGKEKKYNNLMETYQIAILAKEKFFPDENFAHSFSYYDAENRVSLGGKTRIITIELVKTETAVGKLVEEMTNAERWAVFFEYLTDKEKRGKIIEIINQEEGIAMAVDTLINITQDEREYARMCTLIKSEMDWYTGIAEAEEKGFAKGREEGREEGITEGLTKGCNEARLEDARRMKDMGFMVEQIQAITGLSTETINQL